MFLRCGEDFKMVLDLRRGLRSQRWFEAWVLSKISVLFRDRVWDFSELLDFSFCWYFRDVGKASGWYHVSEEVPGLKGGLRPKSRQRDLCFSKVRLGILQMLLTSDGGSKMWEGLHRLFKGLRSVKGIQASEDLVGFFDFLNFRWCC